MKHFKYTITFALLFTVFTTGYTIVYPRFIQPQFAVQQFETNNSSIYMTANNVCRGLLGCGAIITLIGLCSCAFAETGTYFQKKEIS